MVTVKRQRPFGQLKAARDRDDELYGPARKNDIQGRNRTRMVLWRRTPEKPGGSASEGDRMPFVNVEVWVRRSFV